MEMNEIQQLKHDLVLACNRFIEAHNEKKPELMQEIVEIVSTLLDKGVSQEEIDKLLGGKKK